MSANKKSVLLVLLLAGCAVGPNFKAPPAPAVPGYSSGTDPASTPAADRTVQRFQPGAAVAREWWGLFQCPALDAVVARAIADNPGLDAARATLRQSQDALRAGYGVFLPQADVAYDPTRRRFTPASFGQAGSSSIFNLFTLAGTVSYTLDFFGGERRQIEALGAQVAYQRANERAAYLSLVANVADAVIARAAYQAEVDATEKVISFERAEVRLAEVQARAGTIPYSNVLSLQSELAATEASIPQLRQKLRQTEDLLATLVGRTPAGWTAPKVEFSDLTLPGDLPLSLPSSLVRQRPDIAAAEALAHAASASIGVATAAMLPNISLTGSYGGSSPQSNGLFAEKARVWDLAGDVTLPIFRGGTLWYERKEAADSYRQSMAAYRQTVLAAFAQVADVLGALEHDAEALEAQNRARAAAEAALRLTRANFQAGIAAFADVLIADTQYHQAVIADLQLRAQRYQDTVALFAALGGGWR